MNASMKAKTALTELAALRHKMAYSLDCSARYSLGNEIFKRLNLLWRDGILTTQDCREIYSEIDAATMPEGREPRLALRTYGEA